MKKLILGLFLTVGTTASVFANNIDTNDLQQDLNQLANTVPYYDLFDCGFIGVTRWYACDGSYTTITNQAVSGACGSYEDNSIVFLISRVDGCPQGSNLDVSDSIYP